MTTTGKIMLTGLLLAGATAAGFALTKKKNPEPDPEFPDIVDNVDLLPKKKTQKEAPGLDYNKKFSKSDKAYVSEMQRLIGVNSDGAWGSDTQKALPSGLSSSFSLNQLISALKIKNTPQAEKNKATLAYLILQLGAAPNMATKQVLNPNGTVSWKKDYAELKAVLIKHLTALKKIGFTPEQVAIAYYNKYKRSLLSDFNTFSMPTISGLGSPEENNSLTSMSMI